jgi:aminoglycoside phosphotransferase (APT) family kinase protein
MLPRDIYGQPNAPDPVLDEATVLEIARRHVPRCSAVTGIDESGGEARVYMIDDDLIFKVQRPYQLRARTSLEKEAFFLGQLADDPEIVVPDVLGYDRDGSIEYTLMTRMPGVAALSVELEGAARTNVLHQLGRTMRRIHSIPQDPFFSSSLFPGHRTRLEFHQAVRDGLAHAVQVIDDNPDLWPASIPPADIALKVIVSITDSVDLVALHSNPGPVHTFVDPDTLEFVGIIDFGDAFISHPAFDWRWPTHEDSLAILRGYCDEEPVTDEFMMVWRAANILNDMLALATRPDRRSQAQESLRSLLATFE